MTQTEIPMYQVGRLYAADFTTTKRQGDSAKNDIVLSATAEEQLCLLEITPAGASIPLLPLVPLVSLLNSAHKIAWGEPRHLTHPNAARAMAMAVLYLAKMIAKPEEVAK